MALLALYANVQKARRDKIEKVTITPVSTAAAGLTVPPLIEFRWRQNGQRAVFVRITKNHPCLTTP